MVPQKTFELRISFLSADKEVETLKENVMAWLSSNGHESFVEGVIDSLDLDPDYAGTGVDMYSEAGGRISPLSLFEYDHSVLEELETKLKNQFNDKIKIEHLSQDTSTWMEGWKDSFKPLETNKFIIHPPWEKPTKATEKTLIEIEPGMAFGTGQHSTTQLCLRQLEKVAETTEKPETQTLIDIGTGSGILAIAAKKMGFGEVNGTDIEAPAVHAAQENAKVNNVDINIWKGSVPVPADNRDQFHKTYDVIVANILIIVLERIIFDISEIADSGTRLVLSGFLKEQEATMIELAEEVGFGVVESDYEGDWACLEMEKL